MKKEVKRLTKLKADQEKKHVEQIKHISEVKQRELVEQRSTVKRLEAKLRQQQTKATEYQ